MSPKGIGAENGALDGQSQAAQRIEVAPCDQTLDLARILFTSMVMHYRCNEERKDFNPVAMARQFPKAAIDESIRRATLAFQTLYLTSQEGSER